MPCAGTATHHVLVESKHVLGDRGGLQLVDGVRRVQVRPLVGLQYGLTESH